MCTHLSYDSLETNDIQEMPSGRTLYTTQRESGVDLYFAGIMITFYTTFIENICIFSAFFLEA